MFYFLLVIYIGVVHSYPHVALTDDYMKHDLNEALQALRGYVKYIPKPEMIEPAATDYRTPVILNTKALNSGAILAKNDGDYGSHGATINIIVFSVIVVVVVVLIVISRAPEWLSRMANKLGFRNDV